jgi:hypothetical protein
MCLPSVAGQHIWDEGNGGDGFVPKNHEHVSALPGFLLRNS